MNNKIERKNGMNERIKGEERANERKRKFFRDREEEKFFEGKFLSLFEIKLTFVYI